MNLQYHYHFTAEETKDVIEAALQVVEAVNAPEDLREAVFTKSVDMLSQKVGVQAGGVALPSGFLQGRAH